MSMDISATVEADSTQINADDLVSPRTVTVTGVSKGTPEQPVNIDVAEFPGREYRPCKTMRRVLVHAWGPDASAYIGRRLTLFNDTSVRWGGAAVGGLRISHLSHIDKPLIISLTESRGKRKPHRIEPLRDEPPKPSSKPAMITDEMAAEFQRDITAANTLQELDSVGADLKAWDLGAHREKLSAAWSEKHATLKGQTGEPVQEELK